MDAGGTRHSRLTSKPGKKTRLLRSQRRIPIVDGLWTIDAALDPSPQTLHLAFPPPPRQMPGNETIKDFRQIRPGGFLQRVGHTH